MTENIYNQFIAVDGRRAPFYLEVLIVEVGLMGC